MEAEGGLFFLKIPEIGGGGQRPCTLTSNNSFQFSHCVLHDHYVYAISRRVTFLRNHSSSSIEFGAMLIHARQENKRRRKTGERPR